MTEQTADKPFDPTADPLAEARKDLTRERLANAVKLGELKAARKADLKAQKAYRKGVKDGAASSGQERDRSELFAAHAACMAEIEKLINDEDSGGDGKAGKYKYAPIDKFLAEVRPKMAKHGLSIKDSMIDSRFETVRKPNGSAKLVLICVFEFILRHKSGQYDDPSYWEQGVDYFGAQSYGAAHSYAMKRFEKGLLLIEAGEDDDPERERVEQFSEPGKPSSPAAKAQPEEKTGAKKPAAKKLAKAVIDTAKKELDQAETLEDLRTRFSAMPQEHRDCEEILNYSIACSEKLKKAGKTEPETEDKPDPEMEPETQTEAEAEGSAEVDPDANPDLI